MLYNNISLNPQVVFEAASTMEVDTSVLSRHGLAAQQIAKACGAWEDEPEKRRLIESGTVKELEEDKGAADSTRPIAVWLSMIFDVSPEQVLQALYDDQSSAFEQIHRICVVAPNQVEQFVYDLLVITKECWTLKFERKFSDPNRKGKRYMHLAGKCQPYSNVEFDWKFVRAFATMLGLSITDDKVSEIWRSALVGLIESLGGLRSGKFKDYVRENSAEYVRRDNQEFETAFEQLVQKLQAELKG